MGARSGGGTSRASSARSRKSRALPTLDEQEDEESPLNEIPVGDGELLEVKTPSSRRSSAGSEKKDEESPTGTDAEIPGSRRSLEGSEEESPAGTEAETSCSWEGSEGSDEEEKSPARTEAETRLTEGLSGVGGGGESR